LKKVRFLLEQKSSFVGSLCNEDEWHQFLGIKMNTGQAYHRNKIS